MSFWKMSQCNTTFDFQIKLSHNDLYFTVQLFFAPKNILVLLINVIQASYAVLWQLLLYCVA